MSLNIDYKNRQIIPRWHIYNIFQYLEEISSVKSSYHPGQFQNFSYKKKEKDWNLNKKVIYAIDFVGTALILNDFNNENAIDAAKFILNNKNKTSKIAVEITVLFLENSGKLIRNNEVPLIPNKINFFQKQISQLKNLVRNYPINPIIWIDLAFYYTNLNQKKKAEQCINVALALNRENRFILRSAARFFLHINEQPDKALYYLRKSELSKQDPWLIASEISISEAFKIKSKRLKEGKNIILNSDLSLKDLSELAGSIGTLEFNHGSRKKAKKLFNTALINPNENTVAQAEWIAFKHGISIERQEYNIPYLFETDSWINFKKGNYQKALEFTYQWLMYQPFSSRPATFGSYIASVGMQNDKEAIKIIEEARISSPNDFLLNNNYAFSLANLNRVNDAIEILKLIDFNLLEADEKAIIYATKGLINFRIGKMEQGRAFYKEAIKIFQKLRLDQSLARVYLFLGREEALIKSDNKKVYLEKAKDLAKKYEMIEILDYINKIEKEKILYKFKKAPKFSLLNK